MLGGWLPVVIDVVAALVVVAAIGWRTRRWRLVWVPVCVALGVAGALAVRGFVNNQGMASDPAPVQLWLWSAVCVGAVAVAVVGWRGARWWRRGVSVLAIPVTLLATLSALNQWVGYFPTVQSAWGALTAGPLPDQTDAADLPGLRNTSPATGKLVEVTIPDTASGFRHRDEYVYLPPAWFAGPTPPTLPVVMMVAGEFNSPADWMRSGNIMPVDRRLRARPRRGHTDLRVRRFRRPLQQRHRMRQRPARELRRPPHQRCPPLCDLAIRRIIGPGQLGGGGVVDGWHVCRRPDGDAPRGVLHLRGHRR